MTFLKNIIKNVSLHGYYVAFLFFIFLIIRGIEYSLFSIKKIDWDLDVLLNHSIYLDFASSVCLGFLTLPLCVLGETIYRWTRNIVTTLIILFSATLTTFHINSGRLLGTEIMRFGLDEKIKIITSSADLASIISFVGVLICGLAGLYFFSSKVKIQNRVLNIIGIALIIVSGLIWNNNQKHLKSVKNLRFFDSTQAYFLGNGKIPYLIHSLYQNAKEKETKYTETEVKESINNYLKRSENHNKAEFPFLSNLINQSTLSPFFKKKQNTPNIVLIITESLSSCFSGGQNRLGSYTPFLDSLSKKSLYWPNTLSGAERTYGALPNILGSLPSGTNDLGLINDPNLLNLRHQTLYSALLNYHSSFLYGGWGEFDKMTPFLKYNLINEIIDEEPMTELLNTSKKAIRWGHDDYALFNAATKYLGKTPEPFISTILTLGVHGPYDQKIKNKNPISAEIINRGDIKQLEIAESILSCDQAFEQFFSSIEKTRWYQNTIFIIVGDHFIGSDISPKSPIEAFHVPLIIHSPLLITNKNFNAVVSHRDILPSLVGLLNENFNRNITADFSMLGSQLDTTSNFVSNIESTLCLYNDEAQYILGKHYLQGNRVWEITDSLMNSKPIENDSIKQILVDRVNEQKAINQYTIDNNKLIP